jgi:PIN domain nuclease of toxin-antitoxin system
MRYLLDTHVVIWFFESSDRLSLGAKKALFSRESRIFVSIASAWEFAIKASMNKLSIPGGVSTFITSTAAQRFQTLNIYPWHLESVQSLPFIHRDPFDRLLIATAKTEGMTLITADENIRRYDVKWLW